MTLLCIYVYIYIYIYTYIYVKISDGNTQLYNVQIIWTVEEGDL